MLSCKVVILNWNGLRHLEQFLPSVVGNTPSHIGIVVADNGSDDESCQYISSHFPSVEILRLDKNYGFAEGYNRALQQIDSDLYVLLNSDVEAPDEWIEPLIETMEHNEDVAAVAPKLLSYCDKTRFEYAGASGGFIDWLGYPFCRGRILSCLEQDMGQYDSERDIFWASGACLMFRSKVFHDLGGFDAKFFAHMEEIDLCWRAQKSGWRVAVNPRSKVYHLGGGTLPNNTSKKIYLNYRNNLAMLYKNLPKGRVELVLFIRMVLDGASAMVFLLQGRVDFFKAVFSAHIDYYGWRKELKADRKRIASQSVTESRYIYHGFIILRYMFLNKRFGNMI